MSSFDPAFLGPNDLGAPLLGREAPLERLRLSFELAREQRQTRVLTLVGAGGVGKSRIIQEFIGKSQAGAEPLARVFQAKAPPQRLSYGVFGRLLRGRFGLHEGMDSEAAKDAVREQVEAALEDPKVGDMCHFLGQLMGLEFGASPLTQAVEEDPLQAHTLRRTIVRRFFESDASHGPVVLVFDRLELADADSLDLLEYLIPNLHGPILLLNTARPELLRQHPKFSELGGQRHELIELESLSKAVAAKVMRGLLSPCEGGVPDPLVDAAVNMAGGNPGQLVRMVRIFHDAGVLKERPGEAEDERVWEVDLKRLNSVRLPLTVEDAVALRVSALSNKERRVLEHAAAMGSVFWFGALLALSRMDRDSPELWSESESSDVQQLRERLEELIQRDYLLRMPDAAFRGETEYVFKHNLEREKIAALTSAAAARRYHQTIADWLAQNENVRSQEEYAAMLAQHLEKAGSLTRSAFAYIESADIARQHYAAKKAHEYYAKGLELLGDDDARRRIDALHNHGDVLQLLGKTDEALAAFRQMLIIAYRLNLRAKGGAAHNRIGRLYRDSGDLDRARQHLVAGLALFEAAADARGVAASHDDIGQLLWTQGDYDEALREMRIALEMRKEIADRRSIALSLNNMGLVWMDSGKARKAAEALEAALKIRREINDPIGIVHSLNTLGQLAQDQNQHERALSLYQEAHDVAKEIGERNRIAVVLTNIGETQHRLGNEAEAIKILKEAELLCEELGDKLQLAETKRGLAKAYLKRNELRLARTHIKQAVDLLGQVRSKSHLAVALRTLGEVTGAGAWGEGHEARAVDYFMRSIAICKETGNELEVAKSYAAFAKYVKGSEQYRNNRAIQTEAQKLSEMAHEIFERHRLSSMSY